MFVLNVDQARSRSNEDLIPAALEALEALPGRPVLDFERTVGDEIQGVLSSGAEVVASCRELSMIGDWHVAVGLGAVETPYPSSTREARGDAFLAARRAAEEVKVRRPSVLVLGPLDVGHDDVARADADVALRLLSAVWARRSEAGWAAVQATERVRAKRPKAALSVVAQELGISHQALSQRLRAADWDLEAEALGAVGRLLDRADASARAARGEVSDEAEGEAS